VKRAAAIILLGILTFNFFGYRILTSYLEDRANGDLEARLDDNNFDPSQLISVKVPASKLAYYSSSHQFARVDGQIEISGVQYKYVKLRVYNDSLELMCIPNPTVMNLRTAKDDFFKLVNDLQRPGQDKKSDSHPDFSKSFSTDYYTVNDIFVVRELSLISSCNSRHYSFQIPSCYAPVAEQPPDFAGFIS
jgi:hypothetical protein